MWASPPTEGWTGTPYSGRSGTNILIESLVICRALLFIGGKLDRTVLLFVLIYTQLGEMFQLGIQGAMILAGDVGDLTQKRFRKTYAGLDAG